MFCYLRKILLIQNKNELAYLCLIFIIYIYELCNEQFFLFMLMNCAAPQISVVPLLCYLPQVRAPKILEPTRTFVLPHSMAKGKSPDIPILI